MAKVWGCRYDLAQAQATSKVATATMSTKTLILVGAAVGMMAGCGGGVKPPKPIVMPEAKVLAVEVVNGTDEGSQLKLYVSVVNSNDTPLPLTDASYQLTVADRNYETVTEPNVTIPANGRIDFTLPAVLKGSARPAGQWSVQGTLEVKPLRTFDQLLLGWFQRRPRMPLVGKGQIGEGI